MERKRVTVDENSMDMEQEENQPASKRRTILSHYRKIEKLINDEKDELANLHSSKFLDIMNAVENIHQHVDKPREQVADAETLFGLTRALFTCAKTHTSGGVNPAEFVSCLITQFGQQKTAKELLVKSHGISWKTIGSCVSPIFMNASGCKTMIGPMNNKIKPRKLIVRAKRSRPTWKARPRELLKTAEEKESETDMNIKAMYDILKKVKKVKVENLMLNRHSFAQTVENLFALSFLVKDGRVAIGVDENGAQFAVPRNGPSAKEINNGVVKYDHFIFRLDFNDWERMKAVVTEDEEVMAPRPTFAEVEAIPSDSELTSTTTSVKEHSGNYKAFSNWL